MAETEAASKPDLEARYCFWPKWFVHYQDGSVLPNRFTGPQGGTQVEYFRDQSATYPGRNRNLKSKEKDFEAGKDIIFIPNYVFEHCENKDATLHYVPENGAPSSLLLVECVGINANALSVATRQEDKIQDNESKESVAHGVGDIVWGKQLRFILRNFPSVQLILITATTVLDMYRPSSCPLPYQLFHQIEAIDAFDRGRLGILDNAKQTKAYFSNGDTTDFVLKAWDETKKEWPCYKENRVKYKLGPRLGIAGMIFFAKEWLYMEQDGEHGTSCRIRESELPEGPIREAVRSERATRNVLRIASRGKAESCPKKYFDSGRSTDIAHM